MIRLLLRTRSGSGSRGLLSTPTSSVRVTLAPQAVAWARASVPRATRAAAPRPASTCGTRRLTVRAASAGHHAAPTLRRRHVPVDGAPRENRARAHDRKARERVRGLAARRLHALDHRGHHQGVAYDEARRAEHGVRDRRLRCRRAAVGDAWIPRPPPASAAAARTRTSNRIPGSRAQRRAGGAPQSDEHARSSWLPPRTESYTDAGVGSSQFAPSSPRKPLTPDDRAREDDEPVWSSARRRQDMHRAAPRAVAPDRARRRSATR